MSTNNNNKIKKWDIFFPEPLILDNQITDEMIVERLLEVQEETEIASIFSSALQPPTESYIVTCTEEELIEQLVNDVNDVIVELEKYDDIIYIIVKDLDENIIGRGEITEASPEIETNKLNEKFNKKLTGFKNKYIEGVKRMNNLTYTLSSIGKKIVSLSKDDKDKKKFN